MIISVLQDTFMLMNDFSSFLASTTKKYILQNRETHIYVIYIYIYIYCTISTLPALVTKGSVVVMGKIGWRNEDGLAALEVTPGETLPARGKVDVSCVRYAVVDARTTHVTTRICIKTKTNNEI